ncbi:MAG: alpha/beta hydrolase [Spirochaetales bacterium]|nr:alpha/beta hydrolase [Spirochaetales bacterium]
MNRDVLTEEYAKFKELCPPEVLSTSRGEYICYSLGKGDPAVLLLPGGLADGEPFFSHLLALQPFGRIITLRYPYIGSIAGYVTSLGELLDQLNCPEVCVMGHSFGGILAQALVRSDPRRFTKVLLSHTTAADHRIPEEALKKRLGALKKAYRLIKVLPGFMVRKINAKKLDRITSMMREEEREFWVSYFRDKFDAKERRESLCMLKAMIDFGAHYRYSPEDLKGWAGEMLIIDSEGDNAIPRIERECVRRLYPRAERVTFEALGHMALLSERDRYISLYKRFFFPETSEE